MATLTYSVGLHRYDSCCYRNCDMGRVGPTIRTQAQRGNVHDYILFVLIVMVTVAIGTVIWAVLDPLLEPRLREVMLIVMVTVVIGTVIWAVLDPLLEPRLREVMLIVMVTVVIGTVIWAVLDPLLEPRLREVMLIVIYMEGLSKKKRA